MEPTKASDVKIELVHGGDAAAHQRRVLELLEQLGDVVVLDIQLSVTAEPNSRIGIGYSTLVVYRPA
ncbi:MAG: hypothetical protein HYU66_07440 [Armatimonadetes bacterium]|nr:hypothetical protein [Armatimonadota bacterium]